MGQCGGKEARNSKSIASLNTELDVDINPSKDYSPKTSNPTVIQSSSFSTSESQGYRQGIRHSGIDIPYSPRDEKRAALYLSPKTPLNAISDRSPITPRRTPSHHSNNTSALRSGGTTPKHARRASHDGHDRPRYGENEEREDSEKRLDKKFGYQKNIGLKYELEQEIGRGHFGHTCLAKVKKGERKGSQVAIKVIPKSKMTTAIAIDDVKREVKILQALDGHEHVVKFYDAYEDPLNVYIVMELCAGGELLERILQRGGRYSEKDAIVVIRQILSVVAFCHQQGVVHRDLKPENFLFSTKDDNSPIRAIDFGLSDFIKPDQRLNDIVGSAYYIAPEVLHRAYSVEADVWSVGVITYILLCGSRPFWARSESGIFRAVLRAEPNLLDLPWPHVSDSAKDFVRRLLSKDLRRRPTAAQALTHPWLRGGDITVPLDIAVYKSIRSFFRITPIRRSALTALVKTLTEEELIYLRHQFEYVDLDKDGIVCLDDFKVALHQVATHAMRESNGLDILRLMEMIRCKDMDFEDFCAAVTNVYQLEALSNWPERAKIAYDCFNLAGNAYVTIEELAKEMGQIDSLNSTTLLEEWTNPDGTISFLGFTRLVHGPSRSRGSKSRGSSLHVPLQRGVNSEPSSQPGSKNSSGRLDSMHTGSLSLLKSPLRSDKENVSNLLKQAEMMMNS